MNVLIFSPGADTGGQGYHLARALNADGWGATALRRKDSWLHYPSDMTWPRGTSISRAVQRAVAEADVIHIMQAPSVIGRLGSTYGKTLVVQHHGSYFRDAPASVSRACRAIGAVECAVDFGLLALAPNAHLLPVVVDLDLMATLRAEHYAPSERVRIFHSPTNRALKQTSELIAAVRHLSNRYPVDLEIVEDTPWMECLRRKASADIVFDQVDLGYGITAVEAWGMGIPVVAGIADPRARELMIEAWGALPFVEATRTSIEAALQPLVADAAYRLEVGRAGRHHAEWLHSSAAVARRYRALIGQAVAA